LEGRPDFSSASPASSADGGSGSAGAVSAASPVAIVGLAVLDTPDVLVLRMVGQLLASSGCTLEIVTNTESPLEVAERVVEPSPKRVVV
jgi:hypothetical protein